MGSSVFLVDFFGALVFSGFSEDSSDFFEDFLGRVEESI